MSDKGTSNGHLAPEDMTNAFRTDDADIEAIRSKIVSQIRNTVSQAGANGVIVAMSGGIDSTLTAALAVEALEKDRVLGIGLPFGKTEAIDANDAREIAEELGIEFTEVQLRPIFDVFKDLVVPMIEPTGEHAAESTDLNLAVGNLIARFRMVCTYYAANRWSRLVLGTSNRSELLLGYFTKYGDGAADLYPIGDLYKTEVRVVADHLGIPRRIIDKEPTARLWPGQTDENELGASYDEIDPLLNQLIDRNQGVEVAAEMLDVDPATAQQIAQMYVDTHHKRTMPPTPGITGRDDERGQSNPLHLALFE